jgi:hypothetical protein
MSDTTDQRRKAYINKKLHIEKQNKTKLEYEFILKNLDLKKIQKIKSEKMVRNKCELFFKYI